MRTAAVSLAIGLCALAEEPPPATGVTVELRAERTEFALGDPILVDVLYTNEGEGTWEIEEPHVLRFYNYFDVRDGAGAKVPNPYLDVEPGDYDGRVTMHKLLPGATVTIPRYVNQCAAFAKPGEYVVTARVVILGPKRKDSMCDYRCATKPLKIKIGPAPDKRTRTVTAAELKALWQAPRLREREEYARYRPYVTEHNGATDALRLLAFRREQELFPFWIERLGDRRSAFAAEALAGLPDRAAVLKALEERLARGELDRFLWLYACLAVPKTDDVEWKDVYARRAEIEKRYRGE